MTAEDAGVIWIATSGAEGEQKPRVERGLVETVSKQLISAVGVEELKKNMKSLFQQLDDILRPEGGRIGVFKVDTVELQVQVTGEGKLCIWGSGATLGTQGGLKLVLKLADD